MTFTFAKSCVMTVLSTVRTAKDTGLKRLALSRTEREIAVASLWHISSVIQVGWVVSRPGLCNSYCQVLEESKQHVCLAQACNLQSMTGGQASRWSLFEQCRARTAELYNRHMPHVSNTSTLVFCICWRGTA